MRIHLRSCVWAFRERTPPRPQGQRPEPENRGVSARTHQLRKKNKNDIVFEKRDMQYQLSGVRV